MVGKITTRILCSTEAEAEDLDEILYRYGASTTYGLNLDGWWVVEVTYGQENALDVGVAIFRI